MAHRLSTIANADKLIALEDGRIIEIGVLNDLVTAGGHFRSLWQLQAMDEKNSQLIAH